MTDRLNNHWTRVLLGSRQVQIVALACGLAVLIVSPTMQARPLQRADRWMAAAPGLAKTTDAFPVFETRLHSVGQVWFALTNYGLIGTENENRVPDKDKAPLKITYSPSLDFPGGTRNKYLYAGGLWVGGIIGTDTLVSIPISGVSAPVNEWAGYDTIRESSALHASIYYDSVAKAEQQFFAQYFDTLVLGGTDEVDGRQHRPLNLQVSQTSYAWSDRFSRQFVIVEHWIKNIGSRPVSKLACGMFMDADILNQDSGDDIVGSQDDVSGFIPVAANLNLEGVHDPLNVAWVADNDGDPVGGSFPLFSPRGLVGLRLLRIPPSEGYSFNWWLISQTAAQAWGPVRAGARAPATGGGLGAPEGDRNRYYVMTNNEVDYGQLYSLIDHTAEGWRPPLRAAGCDIADGLDTRQLLSVGPMTHPLIPGDSVPFVYAICCGSGFHTDPTITFDCGNPDDFVNSRGDGDLKFAATWAAWIYDSPGFDTDNDGYRGQYHLANCDSVNAQGNGFGCDTSFYTGDMGPLPQPGEVYGQMGGLPDLAGPSAPSCPEPGRDFTIETHPGEIVVQWSGKFTETIVDPLSKELDFEGYRLYVSRINSADQYSMIASWDIEDYKRYVYDPEPPGNWILDGSPVPLSALQDLYGDDFNPSLYNAPTRDSCWKDTVLDGFGTRVERCSYFVPQDFNRANTYTENGVPDTNMIQRRDTTYINFEGQTGRYGLYEARLTNLNPSIGLYVSITSFDYGNAKLALDPLESLPGSCNEFAIPVYSADVVIDSGLRVSVYPNPYKASYAGPDGASTSYYEQGFEAPEKRGRTGGLNEQDRRIWFINLPPEAKISIYTLDGDLVRTIDHKYPHDEGEAFLSDYSSRAAWDLVTRNTQAAVSGIYIYRVDSELGSQVGKIVIIK